MAHIRVRTTSSLLSQTLSFKMFRWTALLASQDAQPEGLAHGVAACRARPKRASSVDPVKPSATAEAVGITQQGLQKAFKESYIRSPGQEIRYQRSRAVADLLKCTDATLADISKNCGYCSVDTLINGFKAVYKCTPGEYRKQNQILS